MSDPRLKLRDHMLAAPDQIDPEHLPPRFNEARDLLRDVLVSMRDRGIGGDTIVTVMLSEMLPRMVFERGPIWTATMLGKLAQNIGLGTIPNTSRQ
jgi:hypothetical protein